MHGNRRALHLDDFKLSKHSIPCVRTLLSKQGFLVIIKFFIKFTHLSQGVINAIIKRIQLTSRRCVVLKNTKNIITELSPHARFTFFRELTARTSLKKRYILRYLLQGFAFACKIKEECI